MAMKRIYIAGTVGLALLAAPLARAQSPAEAPEATQGVSNPAETQPSPLAVPSNVPAGEPAVGEATLPRDLSPWGMFIHADAVVKAIMIGLALASFITWTVWLAKTFELLAASRKARRGIVILQQARSVAQAQQTFGIANDPVARLVKTAAAEASDWRASNPDALKERVAWLLQRVEQHAGRRIGRGMGVIATIGATAPFVGLLGTVWGIMNSFIGISNAQTTNLAVVAPGIAEALLATALGLVAAIPAVVIYNAFARSIGGYRALLADAGALVMRLVSRDCDAQSHPMARAAE